MKPNANKTIEERARDHVATPETLRVKSLHEKALDMRLLGLSYRDIAAKLGVTAMTASRWVKAELEELNLNCAEKAEQIRDQELKKLDLLETRLWPAANRGDVQAIMAIKAIGERRGKLFGIETPERHEVRRVVCWADEVDDPPPEPIVAELVEHEPSDVPPPDYDGK